jgi:hypothetical protein
MTYAIYFAVALSYFSFYIHEKQMLATTLKVPVHSWFNRQRLAQLYSSVRLVSRFRALSPTILEKYFAKWARKLFLTIVEVCAPNLPAHYENKMPPKTGKSQQNYIVVPRTMEFETITNPYPWLEIMRVVLFRENMFAFCFKCSTIFAASKISSNFSKPWVSLTLYQAKVLVVLSSLFGSIGALNEAFRA